MKFKNTSTKINYFLKAISARKRIEILLLLKNKIDLSLKEISKNINTNNQNTSLHTFKLLNAGLIAKQQQGKEVKHILTKRGEFVLSFLQKIDKNL